MTAPRRNDVYAEWDTMETVNAVRDALAEHYSVELVEANEEAYGRLRELRPEFAFNMSEGLHGVSREAQIPAILEMLRIPYLGSDPLTLSVCLDKSRAKEILLYYGVPTPAFRVVASLDAVRNVEVAFPSMVKPLHEGSSKGIYNSCVVRSARELEREVHTILEVYEEPALIEDFLVGREFTVAMLGNGNDVRVLPIVELKFDALPAGVNHIYSYEAKWIWDRADNPLEIFECPARVDRELQAGIEKVCRDAYRILRCRDWSRIDVRLDSHNQPNIIEVNPLPGILPKPEDNSCFPKAARATGLDYNAMIQTVAEIGMKRTGVKRFASRNLQVQQLPVVQ
jgi:D-alanine-D-alanine ligase